jgi:hypothetical protein
LKSNRSGGLSAAGLIIYALSISVAAYDWIVSLEPRWYSSGFGLVVGESQMLAAAAFGVAASAYSRRNGELKPDVRQRFHDLGNLLLMYVLTWAYLAFTQFLIIWAADLPREISWYLPRLATTWSWIGALIAGCYFFLPLLILLSRTAKRSPRLLGWLAALLVAMSAVDMFWLVMPAFRRSGFSFAWTDTAALLAMALAWVTGWRMALRSGAGSDRLAEMVHGGS